MSARQAVLQSYPSAQPPSPRHHGTAASTDPGVALNRGPRVRLSRFRELGRHRFDPLRRPMCGGMRCKGRHSPFFSPPIFSALRSASRAAIPPAASAVTLQHSRSSVCSIHRAGQRRLEKAADALKVSWGSSPAELADQDIWKPLRGKEGGAAAIAFDVHLEESSSDGRGGRWRRAHATIKEKAD